MLLRFSFKTIQPILRRFAKVSFIFHLVGTDLDLGISLLTKREVIDDLKKITIQIQHGIKTKSQGCNHYNTEGL